MSMATRTDTQSPALHIADSHDLGAREGSSEHALSAQCRGTGGDADEPRACLPRQDARRFLLPSRSPVSDASTIHPAQWPREPAWAAQAERLSRDVSRERRTR